MTIITPRDRGIRMTLFNAMSTGGRWNKSMFLEFCNLHMKGVKWDEIEHELNQMIRLSTVFKDEESFYYLF